MSEIVVSVIIPTYNGGSLFEEVMDKVLKQKLKDGKHLKLSVLIRSHQMEHMNIWLKRVKKIID